MQEKIYNSIKYFNKNFMLNILKNPEFSLFINLIEENLIQ